jgi:hypothetical protein
MKGGRLLLLLLCLPIGTAAAATQAVAAQTARVQAAFTYAPTLPFTADVVTFTSTSTAPGSNNRIVLEQWDLDADGSYDDGTGTSVSRSFSAPGTYWINLFVLDKRGEWDVGSQLVTVQGRPPPPPPELMSPFPVVQMAGTVTRRGIRVRHLNVEAPPGANVVVRCHGRGCPLRRQTQTARLQTSATAPPAGAVGVVRIRQLDGRLLRGGAVVKLFVTKPGTIGKYTRVKIRRARPPERLDLCLMPDQVEPVACPS